MSEAILIALLGAVFNAGVLWGTMQAFTYRLKRTEQRADDHEKRLRELEVRAGAMGKL